MLRSSLFLLLVIIHLSVKNKKYNQLIVITIDTVVFEYFAVGITDI